MSFSLFNFPDVIWWNNPKIQSEQKTLKQLLLKKKELESGFKKLFDELFKTLAKAADGDKIKIENKIAALKEEVEKKLPLIVQKIQELQNALANKKDK